MTGTLEQSYDFCRRLARRRARNFYYSFVLLPDQQRNAICAIYAFMRYCDDLSDEAPAPGSSARDSISDLLWPVARQVCVIFSMSGGKRPRGCLWPADSAN